jgi:hypothetical protein
MTSVLNVDTIADKAGTGPVGLTKQSAAKAWINFNGTGTIATRNSFSISSISDGGTGNYTTSFTNSMNDADFAPSGCSGETSGTEMWESATRTTSSFIVANYTSDTGGDKDSTMVSIVIHGDLA